MGRWALASWVVTQLTLTCTYGPGSRTRCAPQRGCEVGRVAARIGPGKAQPTCVQALKEVEPVVIWASTGHFRGLATTSPESAHVQRGVAFIADLQNHVTLNSASQRGTKRLLGLLPVPGEVDVGEVSKKLSLDYVTRSGLTNRIDDSGHHLRRLKVLAVAARRDERLESSDGVGVFKKNRDFGGIGIRLDVIWVHPVIHKFRTETDQRLNRLVQLIDLADCMLDLSLHGLEVIQHHVALSLEFLQCRDNPVLRHSTNLAHMVARIQTQIICVAVSAVVFAP